MTRHARQTAFIKGSLPRVSFRESAHVHDFARKYWCFPNCYIGCADGILEEYNEEDEEDGYISDDSVDPDNMTYEVRLYKRWITLQRKAPDNSGQVFFYLCQRWCVQVPGHVQPSLNLADVSRNSKRWAKQWVRSHAASHRTSLMRSPMPSTPAASPMKNRPTVRA